jgi:hypothetical protein
MSLNPVLFPAIPPIEATPAPRPFWSVIVPAYKPQWLEQALRSVIEQDPGGDAMEILVIDDCSPHALEPIVRRVGGDRVRFVRNNSNLGTFATVNLGISMCRGTWTHILNDDDWVLPGFYRTFRAALEHQPESVGAACCAFENVDDAAQRRYSPGVLRHQPGIIENWLARIGAGNMLHPVAVVVRRSTYEAVGGYLPELNFCADWEFYKRSATRFAWWYEPKVLACYRQHAGNTTAAGLADGSQIRELGRAIEISRSYLPADVRDSITQSASDMYAVYSFNVAHKFLNESNLGAALTVIKAGLALSTSDPVLNELLKLLSQPSAGPLRPLLAEFFRRVEYHPG